MQFEITPSTLNDYKNNKETFLLLDMRTQREFHLFHIPGAYSLPILNDEEHKIVSTLYDSGAQEEAKCLAVDYASQKLPDYIRRTLAWTHEYDHVIIYCSRGGMRSAIFYHLLRSLGYSVERLRGGYKAYRKYLISSLEEMINQKTFVVLHGKTGVGKTEILDKLRLARRDVLDLEGLANHRGSVFGSVGKGQQPSQKMFESLLYEALQSMGNIIYTEGESPRIGNLLIPKLLHEKMQKGKRIVIEDTMEHRVNRIAEDYLRGEKSEILESLDRLSRYLSPKNYVKFRQMIVEDCYKEVIEELMCRYYDSHYAVSYCKEDLHLRNDENILAHIFHWEYLTFQKHLFQSSF